MILPERNNHRVEEKPAPFPGRMIVGIGLGTLLNPLNSSMISVALLTLSTIFGVSVATATWLIASFYLAAAVGQPLMGHLAEQFGYSHWIRWIIRQASANACRAGFLLIICILYTARPE